MLLAKLLLVKNCLLLNLFKCFITSARFLPKSTAGWIFFVLRSAIVCSFGFTTRVGEFIKSDAFNVICVLLILIMVQCISKYFSNSDLLKQDVIAHQDICATLEHLRQALDTKSLIEKEAEAAIVKNRIDKSMFFEALKNDLSRLEESNEELKRRNLELENNYSYIREQYDSLNTTSEKSQASLQMKTLENHTLKQKLEEQRNGLSKKNVELKELVDECNELKRDKLNLTTDVQNLKKWLKEVQEESEKLKKQVRIEEKIKDKDSIKGKQEIQKISDDLKTKMSSVAGRLSRVGSVLGDGPDVTRTPANTPVHDS